jgi:hypothetical protein
MFEREGLGVGLAEPLANTEGNPPLPIPPSIAPGFPMPAARREGSSCALPAVRAAAVVIPLRIISIIFEMFLDDPQGS